MIAADDLVHFNLGSLVHVARLRLVVNEADGIDGLPHILGREILPHGGERNEYPQVHCVVIAVSNALERANHLEANPIRQKSAATRGSAAKSQPSSLIA